MPKPPTHHPQAPLYIPKLLLLLTLLGASLLPSCTHRPPTFTIGIYGVPSTNDLPLLKHAGFNTVRGPATKAFLDAAHQLQLRVIAEPGSVAGPAFNPTLTRKTVQHLDAHPALAAWYLSDEPDLNLVPPDDVLRLHRFLKQLHAKKPTTLVLYNGFEAPAYAHIPDILMLDRYPIPWMPLATFDQHLRLARHATKPKQPLYAVIQSFDWSYHPDLLKGYQNLRPPSLAELRCMTYSALLQGVQGLFFYAFDDGKWRILDHPDSWNALTSTVAEVHERLPLFQGQTLWWPWRQLTTYLTRERLNETLEMSVTMGLISVPAGTPAVPPGLYVVAVNTAPREHILQWTIPPHADPHVPVLGEGRTVLQDEETKRITDRFEPYGVHVYGPLSPPTTAHASPTQHPQPTN